MLHVRPEISEVVGKSILITGVARSGTTIMGTLVHTLESVEFIFEPLLLYGLFPLLGEMDPKTWKFLYETYLVEDVLADSLAGRRLNFNRYDISSIREVKSIQDVDARLDSRYRRLDLFREVCNHRVAYKMPDVLPYLSRLLELYPNMSVVVMFREPEAVAESLLDRQWFSGHNRISDTIQGPWISLSPDVPFWTPEKERDSWGQASPLEKSYLYYCWQNEALLALDRKRLCVVDYDRFVDDPVQQFNEVMRYVGGKPGSKTESVLQSVILKREVVRASLGDIAPELRERVLKILDSMGCL